MTIETAVLLGMGMIVLWGMIALLLALKSAKADQHVDINAELKGHP